MKQQYFNILLTLTPPISSTETESTYPRSSAFGWLSFNWYKEKKNIKKNIKKLSTLSSSSCLTIATAPVVRQNRLSSNFELIFRTMSLQARIQIKILQKLQLSLNRILIICHYTIENSKLKYYQPLFLINGHKSKIILTSRM